jgi:hypothetical protein
MRLEKFFGTHGQANGHAERKCANPRCGRKFQGRGRQKYCSRNCSRSVWEKAQRARKVEKKQGETARLRPPGPEFRAALPRARVCSAGLDAVLVLAKRKKRGKSDCKADEKRRLLYQGLDARRRAFTPEIPKLPKPARPIAAELGVAVARDAVFVAAGLRGAPPEVVDQRLVQVPDDDFRQAVKQLMAGG